MWILCSFANVIRVILCTRYCSGFNSLQRAHSRCHSNNSQRLQSFLKSGSSFRAEPYSSQQQKPMSTIVGYISDEEEHELKLVLISAGFQYVPSLERDAFINIDDEKENTTLYSYKYIKASGMLKLIENEDSTMKESNGAPKWIPIQKGEENVLVSNGWSFLDPDEAEPMSAFDIDAANEEGKYTPKWGLDYARDDKKDEYKLSSLGFDMEPMSNEAVLLEAEKFLSLNASSKSVLLEGATDKPNVKITNNGYDFSGSVRDGDVEKGLFVCVIGGLPLFTTADLSPTTASSGWLTFATPVADDHVSLVYPEKDSSDQRIEVICARSGCHLGHYFGKGEGFCINTSALNFIPCDKSLVSGWNVKSNPISWLQIEVSEEELIPTHKIMRRAILNNISIRELSLGAGCFWHVEYALRRLPGMIHTAVGYTGGIVSSPTYKDVCTGSTNHAEVVFCRFDPQILDSRKLLDCFLAMHDPTNVRSHGKRAQKTGQYRSCIFVYDKELELVATSAISDCTKQLAKQISTEIKYHSKESFYVAEDRHQRHDERVKSRCDKDLITLTLPQWLQVYSRRSTSVWGSSETIVEESDINDDGMARMMI